MLLDQGLILYMCSVMRYMHKKGSRWRNFNSRFNKSFPWENTNSLDVTLRNLSKDQTFFCNTCCKDIKKWFLSKTSPHSGGFDSKHKCRWLSSCCSWWRPSQRSQLSSGSLSTPAPERLSGVHLHIHQISPNHKISTGSLRLLETPPLRCLNLSFLLSQCNHPIISAKLTT